VTAKIADADLQRENVHDLLRVLKVPLENVGKATGGELARDQIDIGQKGKKATRTPACRTGRRREPLKKERREKEKGASVKCAVTGATRERGRERADTTRRAICLSSRNKSRAWCQEMKWQLRRGKTQTKRRASREVPRLDGKKTLGGRE